MTGARLLDIADRSDLASLRQRFGRERRIAIPDVLTAPSAAIVHRILAQETPWGLAWQAGDSGAMLHRREELAALPQAEHARRGDRIAAAMRGGGYAYCYACYPLLRAYQERWAPDGPHDMLLEYLNDRPMLELVRTVTGLPELIKADGQATLYASGHFLARHDDQETQAGRRIAYVLNMCASDWRPEWGGMLQFHDAAGDVIAGVRPRFNTLYLFSVPQLHAVTSVTPFAPIGRFAITGWFRDR